MENPIINGIVEGLTFLIGLAIFLIVGTVVAVALYKLTPLAWTPSWLGGLCLGGGLIHFFKGYLETCGANRAKAKGSRK